MKRIFRTLTMTLVACTMLAGTTACFMSNGGALGAGIGSSIGALIGGSTGTIIGAGVGSVVGAGVGAAVDTNTGNKTDNQKKRLEKQLAYANIEETTAAAVDTDTVAAVDAYALIGNKMDKLKRELEEQLTNAKIEETTGANCLKANTDTAVYRFTDNMSLSERISTERAKRVRAQNCRKGIYISANKDMIEKAENGTLK